MLRKVNDASSKDKRKRDRNRERERERERERAANAMSGPSGTCAEPVRDSADKEHSNAVTAGGNNRRKEKNAGIADRHNTTTSATDSTMSVDKPVESVGGDLREKRLRRNSDIESSVATVRGKLGGAEADAGGGTQVSDHIEVGSSASSSPFVFHTLERSFFTGCLL